MATSKRKQTKRKGRGGARPGAGRKPSPAGKMEIMQVKAPSDLKRDFIEWCARRGLTYSLVLRQAMKDIIRGAHVPALSSTDDSDEN